MLLEKTDCTGRLTLINIQGEIVLKTNEVIDEFSEIQNLLVNRFIAVC